MEASRHSGNLRMEGSEAYNEGGLRKRKGAPNREAKTGGVSSIMLAQGMFRDFLGSAFSLLAVGLEQCEPFIFCLEQREPQTNKLSEISLSHTHCYFAAAHRKGEGGEIKRMAKAVKRPSAWHPPLGAKLSRNQVMSVNARQNLSLFILRIPFNMQSRVQHTGKCITTESVADFPPPAPRC